MSQAQKEQCLQPRLSGTLRCRHFSPFDDSCDSILFNGAKIVHLNLAGRLPRKLANPTHLTVAFMIIAFGFTTS